ncbi:translation initiation factor IF-2 [Occallatibacter riparius]|uniref:Translation initiation factor IF-2 n=1 Tax=Occallatibacter riparius TaxID=1002689 RepID=A0A9J7BUM4_9BACT|nr:translation initiation factor IF-2 [Occallatibacter riparius]UWZ86328.1 translation initiation factor IF-2 [Occallatibacter riparius]
MSKVRINDLAREMEVKSRQVLDALTELGLGEGKLTHSSSIEDHEADKVRSHFGRGAARSSQAGAGSRAPQGLQPKIDLSHVHKPGDVVKAILAKKQEEEEAARRSHAPVRPAAPPAKPAAPVAAKPPVTVATPAAPPAPRKIMPPVRQAPPIISAPPKAPAIASKPPAGAVVAKPPAGAAPAVRPAVASAPPAGTVVVKPPVAPPASPRAPEAAAPVAAKPPVVVAPPPAPAPAAPAPVQQAAAPAPVAPAPVAPEIVSGPAPVQAPPVEEPKVAPAPVVEAAPEAAAAPEVPAPAPQAPAEPVAPPAAPAPPVRRVVMPQTGPRPVYKAPIIPPAAPGANAPTGNLQRNRPIFDRRAGAPAGQQQQGGFGQRPQGGPGGYAGGPRPKHPTRSAPGGFTPGGPGGPGGRPGFGQRPGFGGPRPGGFGGPRPGGFGAPGAGAPPTGEAPRPSRGPSAPKGRGRQQYPKTKEGPMKGFVPPPRFGGAANFSMEPLPITREITVTEGISVKDLAEKLEIRAKDLIAILLMRGIFVTVNQTLDADTVKDVAARFGAAANVITYEEELENQAIEEVLEADKTDMVEVPRAPVVTVMGHVDHGKTSLLDAIRETDVAAGEAGGITQHIGAYKVKFTKEGSPASGREIVFLDTPGHEAFTRMRARGAKVTDIVVIVVAADDGVMPQTLEAVDHAKAADVPIIVAINKIDKPEANPDRVMKQLADRGLTPDDWGGDTPYVKVSAKKRVNLDGLLEMICLVSDVKGPKATPGRKAVGSVLEAKLDRGRGAVATVLVQDGTLKLNESYIVGNTFGKVRAMFDDRGRAIEEAGPSTPVEVLGLEAMPDSGDTFLVVGDRDKAKGIASYRKMKEREAQLAKSSRVSLEGLAEQIRTAGVKDLPLIIKGDVTGSVEVLGDSLIRMSTEKVRVKVIRSGVGSITESDVLLATASNAIIIGFNVRPERKAAELAQQEGVDIRLHSIIYELQDEMRLAMMGLLEPTFKENYIGRAQVLQIFRIPKVGTIAGCSVRDGVIRRDAEIKVVRDGEQIHKGKIASLKRVKDDVREVTNGMECGIGIHGFSDLKEGDILEAFTTEKMAADLGALTSAKA